MFGLILYVCISIQEVKDFYLFGFVALLLILDMIFMLCTTLISSAILRRKERELSSNNVSNEMIIYSIYMPMYICRMDNCPK